MAIRSLTYSTGRTLKTVLRDFSTGIERLWNTTLNSGVGAFEAYNASNIANYGIATTEGTSGLYTWIIPNTLPAVGAGNEYQATTYDCAAAALATGDLINAIWLSSFGWDGTIAAVSLPKLAGLPADKAFRVLIALLGGKTTIASNTVTFFDTDNITPVLTIGYGATQGSRTAVTIN